MSKPKVSEGEMLDTLEHCRLTMTYHEVQALAGKWNEHDEDVIQAIRAVIEKGQPEVDEEFVEKWRRKLQQEYGSLAGFEYADIEAMLREAGVRVKEEK